MPRRSSTPPADVRQRILDAAMSEFSHKGYHGAILDDIAAKAQVSKGAVYWHFENKRALFLAAAQQEVSRFAKHLEAAVGEPGLSSVARLEIFVNAGLTYYTVHPDFCNLLKIFLMPGGLELDQEVEVLAREEYRKARKMVEALLQDGVQRGEVNPRRAEAAAPMLVALLDGLMFQWILDRRAVPLRQLAPDIARVFLEGILPTAA